MKNGKIFSYALLVGLIGIFLMGCATGLSAGDTPTQADLLTQAGFIKHTAKDQHVAYIKTLPAKKVVLNQYQNKPLYLVCTSPESNSCFLGDQAAYQRYQQLAVKNAISEDRYKVHEKRWDPEAVQMWADSQGAG